jgi:hypothetical protein
MKKWIVLLMMLVATTTFAQNPPAGGTSKLAWDIDAPSLTEAQGYTYRYYVDGATSANAFEGVVCSGSASPYQCIVSFPAFTPGAHVIQLTAGNIGGESAKSTPPFGFTFVIVPAAPKNIIIK